MAPVGLGEAAGKSFGADGEGRLDQNPLSVQVLAHSMSGSLIVRDALVCQNTSKFFNTLSDAKSIAL
jgi:hypothetical protein